MSQDTHLNDSLEHVDGGAVVPLVVRSVGLLLQLLQLVRSHQLIPSFFVVWRALQLKITIKQMDCSVKLQSRVKH